MNLQEFVNIHQQTGFQIQNKEGQYFLNRGLLNYAFPQLSISHINKKIVNSLKWKYLITVIKTDFQRKNTYEYILNTNEYEVESFRKRTRTTVRKSLKSCEFKRPPLKDLITDGLLINIQTLKIQKRKDKFLSEPKLWEKYITLFYEQKDTIIIGAYFQEKLIAYAIAYEVEGKQSFHLQHINRDYATYYPMSGLMYVVVNELLKKHNRVSISDGIESFTPMPTLNKFKRYMRFDRVPITRVYILNPILLILIKSIVTFYISILGKRSFKNTMLRKVVDLYQGHRILTQMIKEHKQEPEHVAKVIYQDEMY